MGRGFVAVVTLLAFVLTGGGGPWVWRALAADEIAEQVRLTGHVLPALARSTELPRPWYAAAATFISDALVGTPLTITVVRSDRSRKGSTGTSTTSTTATRRTTAGS